MLTALLRRLGFEDAARQSILVPLLEAQIHTLQDERDYWRRVSERLLDAALLKRGDITRPVFETPERTPENMLASLFANMAADTMPTIPTHERRPD